MKITVNKDDIKEFLDEEEDCVIQVYADQTYAVLPVGAYGYEGKIANFMIEHSDFVECGYDYEEFCRRVNDGFYHVAQNPIDGEYIEITVA